jgi:YegS/Rv2252/BmrU family lipid kinase
MKSENYILLVANPISGDCDKAPIISAVKTEAAKRGCGFELYETTGENDKKAIQAIIAEKSPSRVVAAGGDGTISMVAECILSTEICLGIIPAGSANGMAVNFDLPQNLEQQITIAFSDCTMKLDALFINNKICLHIADLGINAELIKNYEQSGIRGKFGYLLQSVPTLLNTNYPYQFTVETETETLTETGILLGIANANKFGTGATINPHGKMNDGKFEILIFKNLDFIEIFKTISDRPELSDDFVRVITTKHAKIRAKNKVPFQIDGEFLGEIDQVEATVQKESLLMALPESFCNLHLQKNY